MHHRLRLSLGSSPPISPTPFLAGVKRGEAEEAWGSLWAQDRAERGSERVSRVAPDSRYVEGRLYCF